MQIFGLLALGLPLTSALTNAPHWTRASPKMTTKTGEKKIIIAGGGIYGASIAYHLAQRGIGATVVDTEKIGAAASGRSGGFLAREWGDRNTQELHHIGYDMHEAYAKKLGISSYRKLPTLSVDGNRKQRKGAPVPAAWLDRESHTSFMDSDTAQVTPMELTQKMFDAAVEAAGTKFIKGSGAAYHPCSLAGELFEDVVLGSLQDGDGQKVVGVVVDGKELPCDQVVVAMGPWSVRAEQWFSIPVPMVGIKSTSLLYEGMNDMAEEPFALFCNEDRNGCHLEVFPRPDGSVYICGCGGSDHVQGARLLPGGDCEDSSKIGADPTRVMAANASFRGITSAGGDKMPDTTTCCMRPCPSDGLPLMGPLPHIEGAYMCCGHNCWGILWSLVSGKVMEELLLDGKAEVTDISAFAPGSTRGTKREKLGRASDFAQLAHLAH
ncbi:unnamed protein product [Chrysoparadoxa australica]